jgi:beta-lactamase class D
VQGSARRTGDRIRIAMVESQIVLDERNGFTLRGKTGLGAQDGRAIGWLVGIVDRAERSYAYATLVPAKPAEPGEGGVSTAQKRIMPIRRSITERLIARSRVGPA